MTWPTTLALVLAGAAWWTLLEYLLHRFAFHANGRLLGRRHLQHHARLQVRWLAIAPVPSMVLGAGVHAAVFLGLMPLAIGAPLLVGLLAGYVTYEWVHWSTHYRVPKTRVGRFLRAYHLLHHHKTPRARFGVTSPLWDLVFRTYGPVPRRAAGEA